jgi:hypothetical protein
MGVCAWRMRANVGSGTIPAAYSSIGNLVALVIYENRFTGTCCMAKQGRGLFA